MDRMDGVMPAHLQQRGYAVRNVNQILCCKVLVVVSVKHGITGSMPATQQPSVPRAKAS